MTNGPYLTFPLPIRTCQVSFVLIVCLSFHSANPKHIKQQNEDNFNRDILNRLDYFEDDELGLRTWPDAKVYYEISPLFNHTVKRLIRGAMNDISSKTCVKFIPRRNGEEDFVFIRLIPDNGCFTQMGRRGGMQFLTLDNSRCLQHGRIMHELMHSLGFSHEHQRPDRDEFIEIMWDNIKPNEYSQFTKNKRSVDYYVMGLPYDLESITHYANVSPVASIDVNKPIILPKVRTNVMGQREYLSSLDVHKINKLYDCINIHKAGNKYNQ